MHVTKRVFSYVPKYHILITSSSNWPLFFLTHTDWMGVSCARLTEVLREELILSLIMNFSWQPRWWDGEKQTSGYSISALVESEGCGASVPTSPAVQVGSWIVSGAFASSQQLQNAPEHLGTAGYVYGKYRVLLLLFAWKSLKMGPRYRLGKKQSECLSFIHPSTHSFNSVCGAPPVWQPLWAEP